MAVLRFENVQSLAGLVLVGTLIYTVIRIIYNVYFHPLASFPGPLLRRMSRVPWTLALLRGSVVFDAAELHRKYGPVVRTAPNELAFLDPRAWRDIMGGGAADIPKWIAMYGVPSFMAPHILNTTSKEHHHTLRKALSPGFSDVSLRAQEPLINRYIDLMVRRLRLKSSQGPVNMEMLYRYVVFDIICDLAFGNSLGCLESDGLHPWVSAMVDGAKTMGILTAINMWPAIASVINPIFKKLAKRMMRMNTEMVAPVMKARVKVGDRPDLINPFIQMNMSTEELVANATVLIGAGAETSTSVLTGVTSLLLENPEKLKKLTIEVRSAFRSEKEITSEAVARLPFLVACLDETMRLFPQVGSPSLRLTDRPTIISGIPVPKDTVVGIWPWAMNHAPAFWTDPDKFHPERFMGDPKYANDSRDVFKPFFTGTRDCIGQSLALIEMRLILARIIFGFDLELTPDASSRNWTSKQKNLYIVWSKAPMMVQLRPVT
ncbi:isotrichodermin C-15 hydroxylase [Xylariaceae sp. FL0255]|nr:isotrichodermin C-15 hydroxylase [Xylariaceae sp. FL0255]